MDIQQQAFAARTWVALVGHKSYRMQFFATTNRGSKIILLLGLRTYTY
jgi:hypothetical protein